MNTIGKRIKEKTNYLSENKNLTYNLIKQPKMGQLF